MQTQKNPGAGNSGAKHENAISVENNITEGESIANANKSGGRPRRMSRTADQVIYAAAVKYLDSLGDLVKRLDLAVLTRDLVNYVNAEIATENGVIETENAADTAWVKNWNMSRPDGEPAVAVAKRRPLPEMTRLTPTCAALIATSVLIIRMVTPAGITDASAQGMLCVYCEDPESPAYGTYELADAGTMSTIEMWLRGQLHWSAKKSEVDAALAEIQTIAGEHPVTEVQDQRRFIFGDQVFDCRDRSLSPVTPDFVAMAKIQTRMPAEKPDLPKITDETTGETWDPQTWIESCLVDPDLIKVFPQIVQGVLRGGLEDIVIFLSESGGSGKGTMLEMFRGIIGGPAKIARNIASVNLDEMGAGGFKIEPLATAGYNFSDETPVNSYIDKADVLKALATGDSFSINRKNKAVVTFQRRVGMILCANAVPRSSDTTGSMKRRMYVVPFPQAYVADGRENRKIKGDYVLRREVAEWVLWQAFMETPCLERVDRPQCVIDAVDDFVTENDPVSAFYEEYREGLIQLPYWPVQMMYDAYLAYARKNIPSGKPLSNRAFTRRLNEVVAGDGWRRLKNDKRDEPRVTIEEKTWAETFAPVILETFADLGVNEQGRAIIDPVALGLGAGQADPKNVRVDGSEDVARWSTVICRSTSFDGRGTPIHGSGDVYTVGVPLKKLRGWVSPDVADAYEQTGRLTI